MDSAASDLEDDEPPGIEVVLADPAWRRAVPRAEALARRAAIAALAAEGAAAGDGGMTILLADDRALRRLNAQHRGKDKPTNVLSFPGGVPGHLGDIALALGVVRRESQAAGRRIEAHLAHLVAHGTLHLLGHDHLEAGEARRMERAEARVMARLRLPNPWKSMAARRGLVAA
jgi:probable rRNA maturation factor